MKRSHLTSERITLLAAELTMFSAPPTVGHADTFCEQLVGVLRWHRDSCRPAQLARRLVQAIASRRFRQCLTLIDCQQAMLQLAAEDCCDELQVLNSLVELSAAVEDFELGPEATTQQRLALSTCRIPEVRDRFALLVRSGEIESTSDGLRLPRANRLRTAAYWVFAMLVGWPTLLFAMMAMEAKLTAVELVAYICGSVVMAVLLTRGLFAELKSDERTVQDLNAKLKPRSTLVSQGPNE